MGQQQSPSGRRIPAADFQLSVQSTKDAQSQARKLIETAQREARAIIDDAEAQAASRHRELVELSHAELRSFIDEDRLKRHARTFVTVLSEINAIRKSHAEMTPWLIELVDVSLHRVIGEMDSAELTARIVRQGIRELHNNQNVALLVHPDDHAKALAAKDAHSDFMAAISDISTDMDVPIGTLKLSCEVGTTSLCVEARIEEILDAIQNSHALRPAPKVQT